MISNEKTKYLSGYKVLSAKIERLKYMIAAFPEGKEKYEKQIAECNAKRDKMECEIDNIDGGILSEVVAEKYICGKSLEQIANTVGYCKRQIERLHIKAMEKFCIS